MGVIIRTAFNNQKWSGQCQNADRDRRLFQCRESVIDVGFKVTKGGQCTANCWEQSLCSDYAWYSSTGNFGERANGNVYFVYRDVNETLVLWGKSQIRMVIDNKLIFRRFRPISENSQVRGLTYKYLNNIGVSEWRSGTFHYINDETASVLDSLILECDATFIDPSEEYFDTEGRLMLKRHVTKERSARLVRAFKSQLTDYSCSVCGFSFEKTYGELGRSFIEAHHQIPINTLTEETTMSVSDLIAVCSNCHRMLHRSNQISSVEELRAVIVECRQ